MSGKKNSFNAILFKEGNEKDVLYSVDGQWNEAFTIKQGSSKHGTVVETYDSNKHPTTKLIVPPLEEQSERESKKAWKKVADAIIKGDMDTTSHEKSKIEVKQREMRKKESAENKEWQRTFFSRVKEDAVYDKLAKVTGEKIESDKTNGIWRFDAEKAKSAQRPFTFDQ
jgi:oxysterol-binding protein-related protein 9/10/11